MKTNLKSAPNFPFCLVCYCTLSGRNLQHKHKLRRNTSLELSLAYKQSTLHGFEALLKFGKKRSLILQQGGGGSRENLIALLFNDRMDGFFSPALSAAWHGDDE